MSPSPLDKLFSSIPNIDTAGLKAILNTLKKPKALDAVRVSIEKLIEIREIEARSRSIEQDIYLGDSQADLALSDNDEAFRSLVSFFENKDVFPSNSQLVDVLNGDFTFIRIPQSYAKSSRKKIAHAAAEQLMLLSVGQRKEIISRLGELAQNHSSAKGYEKFFKFMLNDE